MLKKVVEVIRSERLKQQKTMEELSLISGVSKKQICNIENGKVTPEIETLNKLAQSLGLVIDINIKTNIPTPTSQVDI